MGNAAEGPSLRQSLSQTLEKMAGAKYQSQERRSRPFDPLDEVAKVTHAGSTEFRNLAPDHHLKIDRSAIVHLAAPIEPPKLNGIEKRRRIQHVVHRCIFSCGAERGLGQFVLQRKMAVILPGESWTISLNNELRQVVVLCPANAPGCWECIDVVTGVLLSVPETWFVARLEGT
jgi:hypothetical protein